jgi:hypothetical protein
VNARVTSCALLVAAVRTTPNHDVEFSAAERYFRSASAARGGLAPNTQHNADRERFSMSCNCAETIAPCNLRIVDPDGNWF